MGEREQEEELSKKKLKKQTIVLEFNVNDSKLSEEIKMG